MEEGRNLAQSTAFLFLPQFPLGISVLSKLLACQLAIPVLFHMPSPPALQVSSCPSSRISVLPLGLSNVGSPEHLLTCTSSHLWSLGRKTCPLESMLLRWKYGNYKSFFFFTDIFIFFCHTQRPELESKVFDFIAAWPRSDHVTSSPSWSPHLVNMGIRLTLQGLL